MQRATLAAGRLVLIATAAALLAHVAGLQTVLVGGVSPTAGTLLAGALALVGSVTTLTERRDHGTTGLDGRVLDRADLRTVGSVAAGAGLTHVLSIHAGLGPVVASALVGVGAGLAADRVAPAAYCGSFVGMASRAVLPGVDSVVLAGVVAGLGFVLANDAFAGFGGKLGTLALFGCGTTALLTGGEYAAGSALAPAQAVLVVPAAAAGAVVTVVLSRRLGFGAVVGSGAVGLVAGLALPALVPGPGGTLAAAVFCASFVGMSAATRLDGELQIGLAGALAGLVFVAAAPVLAGAGGKLGTVAFVSCIAVAGVAELRDPGSLIGG